MCAILFLSHRLLQDSNWSVGRLGFLSLVYALALMTRLDSALFVVVSGLFLVWSLVRQAVPLRAKVYRLLALALPSLILVGGWLFWKMIYYGNILPNTFYAKAQAGLTSPIQGLKYFQLFLTSYFGVPPVSWTPNPLGEWRTRCQEQDELIHPSFASR